MTWCAPCTSPQGCSPPSRSHSVCSRPAFRADVARLERWTDSDVEWLRATDRRSGRIPVARFNAGQKLNAALTIGAVVVLLGTGTVMAGWLWSWPTTARTDATWVHDWTAFALTAAVVGHVVLRAALRATGTPPGSPGLAGPERLQ